MENRVLNIDELASIYNKLWLEQDKKYRQEHHNENIPMESEPSDEESDISIIIIDNKQYYQDLEENIYEIKDDKQIGKILKKDNTK
tara:strand:- start:488 stop:745 length:258 start_codon:yes stop_codon:yes gene_type:complete